jgi:predicted GTPase
MFAMLLVVGYKQPVVVVGNKVDLLPPDSRSYLHNIQKCLAESLTHSGIPSSNIQHIALLSAKTGYGVEELITKLHNLWEYRGNCSRHFLNYYGRMTAPTDLTHFVLIDNVILIVVYVLKYSPKR